MKQPTLDHLSGVAPDNTVSQIGGFSIDYLNHQRLKLLQPVQAKASGSVSFSFSKITGGRAQLSILYIETDTLYIFNQFFFRPGMPYLEHCAHVPYMQPPSSHYVPHVLTFETHISGSQVTKSLEVITVSAWHPPGPDCKGTGPLSEMASSKRNVKPPLGCYWREMVIGLPLTPEGCYPELRARDKLRAVKVWMRQGDKERGWELNMQHTHNHGTGVYVRYIFYSFCWTQLCVGSLTTLVTFMIIKSSKLNWKRQRRRVEKKNSRGAV